MDRTRQYFTLVYGAYDGARGELRYVVAGLFEVGNLIIDLFDIREGCHLVSMIYGGVVDSCWRVQWGARIDREENERSEGGVESVRRSVCFSGKLVGMGLITPFE